MGQHPNYWMRREGAMKGTSYMIASLQPGKRVNTMTIEDLSMLGSSEGRAASGLRILLLRPSQTTG